MLATVKLEYGTAEKGSGSQGTISGVIDARLAGGGPASLFDLVYAAKDIETGGKVFDTLPIGCREMCRKQATARHVRPSDLPRSREEVFIVKLKKHFHRGSKSSCELTVTFLHLSVPRIE